MGVSVVGAVVEAQPRQRIGFGIAGSNHRQGSGRIPSLTEVSAVEPVASVEFRAASSVPWYSIYPPMEIKRSRSVLVVDVSRMSVIVRHEERHYVVDQVASRV